MGDRTLHDKAKRVLPDALIPGGKRYWVAVIHHSKDPSADLVEEDFLWVKCHKKISVSKIHESCRIRFRDNYDDDADFDLWHGTTRPPPAALLRDLNFLDDNLIVFKAVPRHTLTTKSDQTHSRAPLGSIKSPLLSQRGDHDRESPIRKPEDPKLFHSDKSSFPNPGAYGQEPRFFGSNMSPSVEKENVPLPHRSHTSLPPDPNPHSLPPVRSRTLPWPSGMPQTHSPMSHASSHGNLTSASASPNSPPLTLSHTPVHPLQTSFQSPLPFPGEGGPFPPPPQGTYDPASTWQLPPLAVQSPFEGYPSAQLPSLSAFQSTAHIGRTLSQHSSTTSSPQHQRPLVDTGAMQHGQSSPQAMRPDDSSPTAPVQPPSTDNGFGLVPASEPRVPAAEAQFDDEPEERPKDQYLRQLLDQSSPEVLEAGVKKALELTDSLKQALSKQEDTCPDAKQWITAFSLLEKQAERKRTVVGVVGNTGAGKSSVINAMLDEERLVPTNCMRACTAVVTEMSWNDSPRASERYRAEIEFINPEDWAKELETLLNEVMTDNGTVSKETSDENSDAGIAWAKFHAVYPKKTKDMLAEVDVATLMREKSVTSVLGTTKTISSSDPRPFYTQLQRYVDSKEKSTGKKDKKKRDPNEIEYWPLIKVVRIFTKSPALSTGAVIVDLPGVHDSNAARAAVAQGYLKQCTGLWIVAPINRAVDDKAAKNLLGDSFKRQLKYDGGFSSVTFICSKTDDISITEAADSLDLDEQIAEFDEKLDACKQKDENLATKVAELMETQEAYKQAYDEVEEEIEIWESLQDDIQEGKTVYRPEPRGGKRKRGKADNQPRKKRRERSDNEDDFVVSDSDSDTGSQSPSQEKEEGDEEKEEEEEEAPERQPLSEEEIKQKLVDLKDIKKNARRTTTEIKEQITQTKRQRLAVKSEMASIRSEMSAICIAGRNEYSKGAIQQDFALGIKELDQENAIEEDEENFNPDEDIRDYDKVARSLPVFCVSSRAYQKMCGRLAKDEPVPGFKTPEETEIPQLQAHCKKLTEAGRKQACRQFLLNLKQQLNSLYLWSCNDGTGLKLTDEEQRREVRFLTKKLEELEKSLEKAVESCIKDMKQELTDHIFDKYPEVIEESANLAPTTAAGWGRPKQDGGVAYMTYKAIVRRDGVYQSRAAGLRDFNNDLTAPIYKRLSTAWERVFQRRLPSILQKYALNSGQILSNFHHAVEQRARLNGAGIANLQMLAQQVYNYEEIFKELVTTLHTQMNELQRDANREFTPVIVESMRTVYQICTDERGPGSYMRMKAAMTDYVEKNRHEMFKKSVDEVKQRLNEMCRGLDRSMADKSDEIFVAMRRDYMSLIGGAQVNQDVVMPKVERALRAEIKAMLMSADDDFKGPATGEIEPDNEEEKDDNGNEKVEQEDVSSPVKEQPMDADEPSTSPIKDENLGEDDMSFKSPDDRDQAPGGQVSSPSNNVGPVSSAPTSSDLFVTPPSVKAEPDILLRSATVKKSKEVDLSDEEL